MIAEVSDADTPRLLLESGDVIDLKTKLLVPGFIDVHCHGAAGVDVNTANVEGLLDIGKYLARKGVTGWMPTFVPDSIENYRAVVNAIEQVLEQQEAISCARILGVHYEGVFANEKMCGALRPEYFKAYSSRADIDSLPVPKSGVKMITISPEIENGIELAGELVSSGWVVSIGHTNAPVDVLEKAFDCGAKHLTHFFNAMSGIHHRDIGVAGWGLSKQGVTFDIIADGIHVNPEMIRLAVNAKGTAGVTLISDSIAPTGLGDGTYELWGASIEVVNGRTRNEKGAIAGSVITVADAARMMSSLGYSIQEISSMASSNPARLLGFGNITGSIDVGKRADLVIMNESFVVETVIVGGKEVKSVENG